MFSLNMTLQITTTVARYGILVLCIGILCWQNYFFPIFENPDIAAIYCRTRQAFGKRILDRKLSLLEKCLGVNYTFLESHWKITLISS